MKPKIDFILSKLPRKRLIYELAVNYVHGGSIESQIIHGYDIDNEARLKETVFILGKITELDTKAEIEKEIVGASKALGWDAKLTKAFYDLFLVPDGTNPRKWAMIESFDLVFYDRISDPHAVEVEIGE